MPIVIDEIKELIERARRDGSVLLHDVSWDFYEAVLEESGDDHVYVTFDRGDLEIMSPSVRHDNAKTIVARLLESVTLDLDIEMHCLGSSTLRRRDLLRGIEPDECYYIRNYKAVYDHEVDISRDPPPDLAIEVDLRRGAMDRESIYAALGIAEVWTKEKGGFKFFHLLRDGTYRLRRNSRNLPWLRSADLDRFVTMRKSHSDNEVLRAFLKWAREKAKAR